MARPFAHALDRVHSMRGADRAHPLPRMPQVPVAPAVAGLRFALPRPTLADVHVVDGSGARVKTLACGEMSAGEHECWWDGLDEAGARCAVGSYVLRLETNGCLLTSRIVALG